MDIYMQENTTEEKKNDVEGAQVTNQLESSSNELNSLLMDQSLSNTDKQVANDLLMTVQMTKEETKETTQADNTLLNDHMQENDGQQGEQQEGMGPLAQQMGEVMGIKQDPGQASFGVQTIEMQQNMPVVNEPTGRTVAPQRGFFFRAFQKIVKAISFCMVTRHVAKWKHKERSSATLQAARRKADEIAAKINRPVGEAEGVQDTLLQVGAPMEQEQDLKNDATKAPIVWEQAQGNGHQDPTVEVHTQQGDMFSNEKETNTVANSFVVLRYSKNDFRTGSVRRFRLAFGFAPSFDVDTDVMLGLAATIPGELKNQANARSSVGRSYSISEQQVNAILSAAPKEADKGYNLITHNCTTFAVNLLGGAGISDGGLQQEYTDVEGNLELALPMAAARGARRLTDLRETLVNHMDTDDYTVARQGSKLVGYQDIERFENSLNYDGPASLVGYEAGKVGEQLRGINATGGAAGSAIAIADFKSVASADGVSEKMSVLNKYDNGQTAYKVNGIAGQLVRPIVTLAQEVEAKTEGISHKMLGAMEYWASQLQAEQTAYLQDVDKFDGQKNTITAAVQAWMGSLDSATDRDLQMLGYRLIGDLEAIEKEYYRWVNYNMDSGITQQNSTAYTLLATAGILNPYSAGRKNNPLYIKVFSKVFGDETIDDVEDTLNAHQQALRVDSGDPREHRLQISIIEKKKEAVKDHFAAEQYKLNQLAQNAHVSQTLVNEAFATPASESSIRKDPGQAGAITFMAAMFPDAYTLMRDKRLATKEMKDGKEVLSRSGQCKVAEEALDIATGGITTHQDGLFSKMVEAIAYSSTPPLGKSQIVKEVLERIFDQFFITVNGMATSRMLMAMADISKSPGSTEVSKEIYDRVIQKRTTLVTQIESIVDTVLSSK